MVRSNVTRRRRTGRRNLPTRRVVRAIHRAETGVRFTPPSDPPDYSRAPWWPLTLVDRLSADKKYTFADLHTGVNAALKFVKTDKQWSIRVLSVRIWGLSKQAIALSPFEIVSGSSHTVAQLADQGSGINFSRLGWRFGAAARIDPNVNENLAVCTVNGNITDKNPVLVYFQLLICSYGAAEPALEEPPSLRDMVIV